LGANERNKAIHSIQALRADLSQPVIVILAGLAAFLIWSAFQQSLIGLLFLFLIFGIILLVPLGLMAYRLYALMHAAYEIDRDGLRIRWGLRVEEIPLIEIEWVRPVDELGETLLAPFLAIPGAYLGATRLPHLGEVEFAASGMHGLLVIASNRKVIAVSPEDTAGFIKAFQQASEMGSLMPIDSYSTHPGGFIARVLKDKGSLWLLVALVLTTIALVVTSSLLALGRETLSIGFDANGLPLKPVPASNLLLLPVLGMMVSAFDIATGLFFFPRKNMKVTSYAIWGAGTLTMLLLIIASLISFFTS